ncbi:hypothetical protein GUJ93_ZPchr0005g15237 [Zizania palustris]|uniref:Uncharacterized protein n=1 Tax=Zizania palustris TaxID=103762 RepID=A0A8J5SWS9_ZIZPA|nr:hypothetical protein GUJ93_ZPchr0005g15237 [Zizania palustris]
MAEVAAALAQQAVAARGGGSGGGGGGGGGGEARAMRGRGEVDTSSPFESVRQAVDLFGGGAVSPWRPPQPPLPLQLRPEEVELMKVEEQTVKLEMELFVKEKETFKVLKELQATKQAADDLKIQIERVTSEAATSGNGYTATVDVHQDTGTGQKCNEHTEQPIQSAISSQSPLSTLIKLNQAKAFLNMDTIKTIKSQIEEERGSLEKTRERLQLNKAKASSLEADLNKTVAQLQATQAPKPTLEPSDIWLQMKQLNSEKDKHRKIVEDSRYEIGELTATIEHTRSRTKTLQFRIVMAEKLKEASRRGEAFALAERKNLSNGQEEATTASDVTLSAEEHSLLVQKAQEADTTSRKKIDAAMQELDQANQGKLELLERVEEAMAAVETSRKALEEAQKREDSANKAKLVAEEALRRLRSEQIIQNWRPTSNNSVKFKYSATAAAAHRRAGSGIYDVNGLSLVTAAPKGAKTMSIGQILSMKLDHLELEGAIKSGGAKKVSLGQILSQKYEALSPLRIDHDGVSRSQFHPRRRKLGFVVYALLLKKHRHRKRQAAAASCTTHGHFVSAKVV